MAAEQLVFSRCRVWASKKDQNNYLKCKGNDFEGDALKEQKMHGFNKDVLESVAILLERNIILKPEHVNKVLKNHGIMRCL
jgi:hypothetical protein